MLTARALIVVGFALMLLGCGSDGDGDASDRLRVLGPPRAEVTISRLEPADPLPALRAPKRSARTQPKSRTTTESVPESTAPAPEQARPAPQDQSPSTPKPSPSKPKPDSGDDELYLE
jgi:hypothetical protein